jgi:hypothetical protein
MDSLEEGDDNFVNKINTQKKIEDAVKKIPKN